ncbi:matrixin family metalloprotease [Mariniblastus fucicola]|uniref:Matrixin n=1 Tax=Mariniblastus fucicola TaxID=980251 RepID=A0A5B9P5R0_9BACT|nr:matrixin family metalloprotease [Mariniblastus fucicola]QEG20839.1 Matrixin [Mariniblastus fucicola]
MRKIFFLCALLIVSWAQFDSAVAQGFFNPLEELDFWSEEELPLPVYYWDNGYTGIDSVTGLALDSSSALQASINTWNEASVNSLGFSFMGTSTTYQENAVNVSFGSNAIFDQFGAIGVALIDYNVDFQNPHLPRCEWKATGADVVINENFSYTNHEQASPLGPYDLQGLFTHELGHVLGLPHVDNQPAVMNSTYSGLRELQQIDIEMLANEKVFTPSICGLPLSSAGRLEWSLSADSGSGFSNIEDALVLSTLSGDIPQTTIPGVFEPEAKAIVSLNFDEDESRDDLVISLEDGYLADGSLGIEFGVTIEDLAWEDQLERQLLGVDENGQVQLEIEFLRLESIGPTEFGDVVDSTTMMATVAFDGSRLQIEPMSYEFDEALFFDFATFSSNGLKGIEIRGISFGLQAVPEPNAGSLLLLVWIAAFNRRRRIAC